MRKKMKLAFAIIIILFFLVFGWIFFPSYILIPDIVDYSLFKITYNMARLNMIGDQAIARIGARGSISFIKWMLTSDPVICRSAWGAVNELYVYYSNTKEGQRLFDFIAESVLNSRPNFKRSPNEYLEMALRERAVIFLFWDYKAKNHLEDYQRKILTQIYDKCLTEGERKYIDRTDRQTDPWQVRAMPSVL